MPSWLPTSALVGIILKEPLTTFHLHKVLKSLAPDEKLQEFKPTRVISQMCDGYILEGTQAVSGRKVALKIKVTENLNSCLKFIS